MMRFNTFRYLLKEGIIGLWRNKMMALATLVTIVLSLLIIGMSYILVENIEFIMEQAETKFGITAYIDDSLSEEEVDNTYNQIKNINHVLEVQFVSKEDALRIFSSGAEDQAIFDTFKEDNPLPASFEISVDSIENQNSVLSQLYKITGLEIDYFKTEADMFSHIRKIVQAVSTVIILMLVFTGIMLMSNTIKLTLHIRRQQINIMKYIGATNTFIRLPFLVEGIITGFLGAVVPIGITIFLYREVLIFATKYLTTTLQGFKFCSVESIMDGYIPLCLIVGIGIGIVGSSLALKKHLDV